MTKWVAKKTGKRMFELLSVTFFLFLLWGNYYIPSYMLSSTQLRTAEVSIIPYPFAYDIEAKLTKAEAELIRRWVPTLTIENADGYGWCSWLSIQIKPGVGKSQYFSVMEPLEGEPYVYMSGHNGVYTATSKDKALTEQVAEIERRYNNYVVYNNEEYGFRLSLPLEWADKIVVQGPEEENPHSVAVLTCPWRKIPVVATVEVWGKEEWEQTVTSGQGDNYSLLGELDGNIVALIYPEKSAYEDSGIQIVNWTNRYIRFLNEGIYQFQLLE